MWSIIGVSTVILLSLLLHLHIYSFYERVTWFCIYHDRPMHWRNDTQKKGIVFAKSYASCIVAHLLLKHSRIWCNNLSLSELRLST